MSEDRNGALVDGHEGETSGDLTAPLLSHAIEAVEEEPAVRLLIYLESSRCSAASRRAYNCPSSHCLS